MRALQRNGFRLLLDYHRLPDGTGDTVAEGPSIIRGADHLVEHYRFGQSRGLIPREREAFCVLLLNARHRAMALHVCAVGNLKTCPVTPASVFRPAMAAGAAAVIVAHHHPSGDCTPSPEDRIVTERLQEAGELLGITVLDHVVVGAAKFYSFADGRKF